jgi:hypothetical protein
MHSSRWSFADLTAAWLQYNTENSTARKKAKGADILNVLLMDNDIVGLLDEDERWQEIIIKRAVTAIRRELDHLQETTQLFGEYSEMMDFKDLDMDRSVDLVEQGAPFLTRLINSAAEAKRGRSWSVCRSLRVKVSRSHVKSCSSVRF